MMLVQSAFARGLLYGASSGFLVMALFVSVAIINNVPSNEIISIASIGFGPWGVIGFLVGYFSHNSPSGQSAPQFGDGSFYQSVRRWIYRVLVGFFLAHIAAAVVELFVVGFVVMVYGDLDTFLNLRPNDREELLISLGFAVAAGAVTGTTISSFLSVLLAPVQFQGRTIIRAWLMAAILGTISGAWVGAGFGLLSPLHIENTTAIILALIGSGIIGVGAAVVLRLRISL